MDIDADLIKTKMDEYHDTNRTIQRLTKKIVNECCSELDSLMRKINECVQDMDNPITDEELDFFILNLPIQVYYAYEQQELIGLSEDMAKQQKNMAYSSAYEECTGTIIERKQWAEREVFNHQMVVSIYNRAGKQIRNKLEIATEMLQSLKKVSTRRMNERTLENSSYGRVKGDY